MSYRKVGCLEQCWYILKFVLSRPFRKGAKRKNGSKKSGNKI